MPGLIIANLKFHLTRYTISIYCLSESSITSKIYSSIKNSTPITLKAMPSW